MRKILVGLLYPALLLVLFCSCHSTRCIYSAAVPNNPYFKEKGDSKVAAYYCAGGTDGSSNGEKNRGYDIQAAYAVSNSMAITASVFHRKELDFISEKFSPYNFDSNRVDYKRNLIELGAGYFATNKAKTVSFNIYGGIGLGKFSFEDQRFMTGSYFNSRSYSSNITKFYLQPSVNFMFSEYVRIGLVNRISFVHYSNISTTYPAGEEEYYYLDKARNKTWTYMEPTFNLQLGLPQAKWVKFDFGFTTTVGKGAYEKYPYSRTFNAFVGACFDFLKMGKRK